MNTTSQFFGKSKKFFNLKKFSFEEYYKNLKQQIEFANIITGFPILNCGNYRGIGKTLILMEMAIKYKMENKQKKVALIVFSMFEKERLSNILQYNSIDIDIFVFSEICRDSYNVNRAIFIDEINGIDNILKILKTFRKGKIIAGFYSDESIAFSLDTIKKMPTMIANQILQAVLDNNYYPVFRLTPSNIHIVVALQNCSEYFLPLFINAYIEDSINNVVLKERLSDKNF